MKVDVYQKVTDSIVAQLEKGTVPWHKPWTGGGPVNVRNGRAYRGINVFLLEVMGHADPRWGTYKAISEMGGQVRKGEHGTHVILWKPVKRKAEHEDEDAGKYILLRDYVVFNAEQADGLPALENGREHEPVEEAEALVLGYIGPTIRHGGDSAYYAPLVDIVQVPVPENFESGESYYSTLFHELVHSTGHKSRLDRLEHTGFGTGPYSKEELVAEMGAAMLCGLTGIPPQIDQSAAYIANWLERLQNDRKLVVQAAANAQRACDLIQGTTFEETTAAEPVAVAA